MVREDVKETIKNQVRYLPIHNSIKKLSLFGSYLNGTAKLDSDIDLLIELKPEAEIGYFGLVQIQNALEKQLQKKVDLVTPNSLSKYFQKEVLSVAEKIYEN